VVRNSVVFAYGNVCYPSEKLTKYSLRTPNCGVSTEQAEVTPQTRGKGHLVGTIRTIIMEMR
jgi:hypothetical protein